MSVILLSNLDFLEETNAGQLGPKYRAAGAGTANGVRYFSHAPSPIRVDKFLPNLDSGKANFSEFFEKKA